MLTNQLRTWRVRLSNRVRCSPNTMSAGRQHVLQQRAKCRLEPRSALCAAQLGPDLQAGIGTDACDAQKLHRPCPDSEVPRRRSDIHLFGHLDRIRNLAAKVSNGVALQVRAAVGRLIIRAIAVRFSTNWCRAFVAIWSRGRGRSITTWASTVLGDRDRTTTRSDR